MSVVDNWRLFTKARLRLTGWYVLMIMIVSLFFSLIIHQIVTAELRRGFVGFERRLQEEEPLRPPQRHARRELIEEDLDSATKRVTRSLILENGVIMVLSAGAGYFLAGKTLAPLAAASARQQRFIADASHELRTPLAALKTLIEVTLRTKRLGVKQARETLEQGLDQLSRLESLAEGLLTLTRLEQLPAGEARQQFEAVAIFEPLNRAIQTLRPLAKKKKLKIVFNKKFFHREKVLGDGQLLEKLLVVILDNAIKYSPKGGEITIGGMERGRGRWLDLRIIDDGDGIKQEERRRVFDRFYRADVSRGKKKGFGLGLSLAKRIAQLHGGTISISNSKERGARVSLRLPRLQ